MKRILLITFLAVSMTVTYSFAQMGQGHMMGQGMSGSQTQQQPAQAPYAGGYHKCPMESGMMGYGGHGMMGPGMMGHMGGMMGRGMMGYGGCGMGPGMMGYGGHGMGPGMMGPGMKGHMGGYGKQGYAPEDYQKFLDDTKELRKNLHDKKFEYFETIRNPEAKRENVLKIEKEIRDLQWDIYVKSQR